MAKKLTEKQKRFADEYIKTGNITQSAIHAGYSKKTAHSTGNENLKKPMVKAYIDERLDELKKKSIAQQDEVLQFLTASMRGEIKEPYLVGEGEGAQIVEHHEPNVATRQRAALELLKRYDSAEMNELKKEQLRKELSTSDSTEDKMGQLLDKLDDVMSDDY